MLLLQVGKTPYLHVYQLSYILITYSFGENQILFLVTRWLLVGYSWLLVTEKVSGAV